VISHRYSAFSLEAEAVVGESFGKVVASRGDQMSSREALVAGHLAITNDAGEKLDHLLVTGKLGFGHEQPLQMTIKDVDPEGRDAVPGLVEHSGWENGQKTGIPPH